MDPELYLPKIRGKTFQKTSGSIDSGRCNSERRDVQSPMVSYLQLRASKYKGRPKPFKQRSRHYSVEGKEPLVSIAGKLPETGYSGGFFNSSAVVKSIPFDRHSALQGISPHKGARTFVIHGDRFLPHIRSISDSVIVRDRRKCSLQRERLSAGEWRREQTQVVKNLLQDPPHRQEYGYYMQGHVCPLQSKDKMATHTQDEPILPKTDLFFGRGIRMPHQPSISRNSMQTSEHSESHTTAASTEHTSSNVFITDK